MIHKPALALATLASLAILAVAVFVGGVAPGPASARVAAATETPGATATPDATIPTDTIYVKPAPSQQVIHKVVPAPGAAGHHEDDHEQDGGD